MPTPRGHPRVKFVSKYPNTGKKLKIVLVYVSRFYRHIKMGKKLELKRIQNPNSRGDSFSKRKRGLRKKLIKILALFDSEVSLIILSETANIYQFARNKSA